MVLSYHKLSRNNATNERGDIVQVDTNKLRGKIVECGLTQEHVAKSIGVDRSTFYRKMKDNGSEFSVGEMHSICDVLSLTNEEAVAIFLSEKSHNCD